MYNPTDRSEKLWLNWCNRTSCNEKRGKTHSNQFQQILVRFLSKGNTLTILAGSEKQQLINLQTKPVWTTRLCFESQKDCLLQKMRITSPKTTYKAVCAQWHPRNYRWAQLCPSNYKGRREMVPAFLLAAVFLGQDHISTAVFCNKVRRTVPWQKCTLWTGG